MRDLRAWEDPTRRNGYAITHYGVSARRHAPGLNKALTAARKAPNAR
jgi:hypothetical protein